ncbi:MAG TPA: hypothetical protein VNI20_14280 [Fimbriimonadaceae bacterium]|nr:hypothetical protein [Fimbriimonadaceae bacterium]
MVASLIAVAVLASPMRSIQEFGVLPSNSAAVNAVNLQRAINWASTNGAALWVEPGPEPYKVDGGIELLPNVSLVGAQGPTGRGTKSPTKPQPIGSVFEIHDAAKPFITVESATRIQGIQFWYPDQTLTDASKVIEYPPTIKVSDKIAQGVTLRDLTFYGEYFAMDFRAQGVPCEQILIEDCYGYPLSGQFIAISRCYDVPRILNTHVNPSNMRLFKGSFSKAVIDSVVKRKTYTYWIDKTDNAQLTGVFTFGVYGGIYLGPATYGQLTSFNFDCVTVGVMKRGDNSFNRNWQIAQGSIIANTGASVSEVHPIVVDGMGHLAVSNVESFSGPNGALTTLGRSQDYLLVRGNAKCTVSLVGCRMRNYVASSPLTIDDPNATVRVVACFDKNEKLFEYGG